MTSRTPSGMPRSAIGPSAAHRPSRSSRCVPTPAGGAGPPVRRTGCPRSRRGPRACSDAVRRLVEQRARALRVEPGERRRARRRLTPRRSASVSARGWVRPSSVSRYVATSSSRHPSGPRTMWRSSRGRACRPSAGRRGRARTGCSATRRRSQPRDGVEQAVALGLGIGPQRRRQPGHDRRRGRGTSRARSPRMRPEVAAHDRGVAALDEVLRAPRRTAGRRRPCPRRTARTARSRPRRGTACASLGGESRLADAGLAGEQTQPGSPAAAVRQCSTQACDLRVAARERELAVRAERGGQRQRRLDVASTGGLQATSYVVTGSGRPLSSQRAERVHGRAMPAAGQDPNDVGSEDLAAVGRRAQPRRLDHRRAEAVAVVPRDVAGADPDADRSDARHRPCRTRVRRAGSRPRPTTASAAPRKVARIPSPMPLTTEPPRPTTTSRSIRRAPAGGGRPRPRPPPCAARSTRPCR